MSEQILKKIQNIQIELNELTVKKDFLQAKRVILSIVKLLDESISINDENAFQLFTDDNGKIKSNAHWFYEDSVVIDRKATYKVYPSNNLNIDFKLYGITKPSKGRIAWVQALTPNFEDEPYYQNDNVGIDFVVPKSADKIIIILSNNWVIRTLELKGELTVTYQEIFAKWAEIKHFDNKRELHNILWDSFDISPLNKKFYIGISERFNILRQYLVKKNIFDEKHSAFFANRLLGRIIFCWFLDKKGIINSELEYFDSKSFPDDNEYYKKKLEKLFFEVLNTPIEERRAGDNTTPFLNGGLFEVRENDLYRNSKLTFPKNYFDNLYDFLLSYNFTTDESTSQFQQVAIDPEMLGRIFENLLAEITEETGEQARKAKGAFYTPREIVDYMCRESLKEYLKTKIKEDEYRDERISQLVEGPIRNFEDQARNWRNKWKPYKEDVIKALDELKILDPACGSGAFPIGMLQLLVLVYERLDARFDSYKTKLRIIEKNIYGIDIEPMAVEIARLRTWLSIIVDEESDSKKIEPLPNLEFKFVCANSLIDLDQSGQNSFWDDQDLDDKMRSLRGEYFNTKNLIKKKKLRTEFKKLISKQENLFGESLKSKQLKTYDPFDNESSAEFFNPEFMFGVELFGIVIGNPPYVSVKKIPTSDKKIFSKIFETGKGRFNLFTLFLEKGQKFLSEKAILTFILPEGLFSNTEYKYIRKYLTQKTTILEVGLFTKRVFEASVDAAIIMIKNSREDNKLKIIEDLKGIKNEIDQKDLKFEPEYLFPVKGNNDQNKIINLMENKIDKLSKLFEIQQGIIYSGRPKEEVFSNEKISDEYKKILDGRDILKYKINWEQKQESRFIKYNKELHRSREERIFTAKEKIVLPRRSTKLVCALDDQQFYLLNTGYVLIPKNSFNEILYILGVLNSNLINFYYQNRYFGWQITIPALNSLPIKIGTKKEIKDISGIVNQIIEQSKLNIDISELEKTLNKKIYELYDIDDELIKIVESSL